MLNSKMRKWWILGGLFMLTIGLLFSINIMYNSQKSKSANYPKSLTYTYYSYNMMAIPDKGHEYVVKIEIHPNEEMMNKSYIEIRRDPSYSPTKENTLYKRVDLN